MKNRCTWVDGYDLDSDMITYHDTEWGHPNHDDKYFFELLTLEIFQAGLSWSTIINKRKAFVKAFAGFNVEKVAKFKQKDIDKLMNNADIIRNRRKIDATINNAKTILELKKKDQSLSDYIWNFNDGQVIDRQIKDPKKVPTQNELSQKISKQMRKDGFAFTGPVIIYSYLQGIGMINDHEVSCDFHG